MVFTPDHAHWLQRFEFYIIASLITLVAVAITISLTTFMLCLKMCNFKKASATAMESNAVETTPEPLYESIADVTSTSDRQDLAIGLVANDAYESIPNFNNNIIMVSMHDYNADQ